MRVEGFDWNFLRIIFVKSRVYGSLVIFILGLMRVMEFK